MCRHIYTVTQTKVWKPVLYRFFLIRISLSCPKNWDCWWWFHLFGMVGCESVSKIRPDGAEVSSKSWKRIPSAVECRAAQLRRLPGGSGVGRLEHPLMVYVDDLVVPRYLHCFGTHLWKCSSDIPFICH